jgi:hypothetical protein
MKTLAIVLGLLATVVGFCLLMADALADPPRLPQAMAPCHVGTLPQAPALMQAPEMASIKTICDCGCANGGPCICDVCPAGLTSTALTDAPTPTKALAAWYQDSYKRALSAGKSLVVGVGCDAPKGKWETTHVELGINQRQAPCILVTRARSDGFEILADLPEGSTGEDVSAAFQAKQAPTQPQYYYSDPQPQFYSYSGNGNGCSGTTSVYGGFGGGYSTVPTRMVSTGGGGFRGGVRLAGGGCAGGVCP